MSQTLHTPHAHIQPEDPRKETLPQRQKSGSRKNFRKIALFAGIAAALGAVVLAAFFCIGPAPAEPGDTQAVTQAAEPDPIVCRVVLRINPSVEFQLGEDGLVLDVLGLNEDGAALIEGIDFSGLSLENATIIVVNQLIAQNYISASAADDVYLSVDGTAQPDTLEMMRTIIQTAASQYELSVDTVQTNDTTLQVVLGTPDDIEDPAGLDASEDTGETALPSESGMEPTDSLLKPVDYESLTPVLQLDYLKESEDTVANILITMENGETLSHYLDFAGASVKTATFLGINKLIADGYLSDARPDTSVVFDLAAFDEETRFEVETLTALMMQEACLSLEVVPMHEGQFILAPAATPAPERTAAYTLSEIYDPTLIKSREDVTTLQMQILSMVYTQAEVEDLLTPRYWAVVPDLLGLSEEKAVGLLALTGFTPDIFYTDEETYAEAAYDTVVFQDFSTGDILEIGQRFYLRVKKEKVPVLSEGEVPSALLRYLPTFLDDAGQAQVVIDRQTGIGVPVTLKETGWEVEIDAYGGRLAQADASSLYGDVRFHNDPAQASVYWAALPEEGNDIPVHATLAYYVYQDGECIASVVIQFTRNGGTEDAQLSYTARPVAFAEGGPYSFSDFT